MKWLKRQAQHCGRSTKTRHIGYRRQLSRRKLVGKTRKFPCFTIYYSPRDFPGKYVVRLFDANMPTRLVAVKNTLEDARATIPQDQPLPYMRFEASEKDAPSIVESWM